jgi:serine/threonine protein kinase
MSPEQLQGKPTDARSDIFSFGCVLYEILTGKRAFRGDSQATLIAAIMDREPEPLIVNQPVLARIVKKCLAKDPDDRWQSASDLKSELEWLLEVPAPIAAQQRTSPRLPWVLAGLFAGVIAALLLSFALFIDRAPAPPAVVRFEIPPPDGTSWDTADFPVISPDGSRIMFAARPWWRNRSTPPSSRSPVTRSPLPIRLRPSRPSTPAPFPSPKTESSLTAGRSLRRPTF